MQHPPGHPPPPGSPPGGYGPPGQPPPGGYGYPQGGHGYQGWRQPPPQHAPLPVAPFQNNGVAATGCPRCGSGMVHQPSYTWWGGIVGPKLFNHTVCSSCGFGYNWKTGKSNTPAIAIYFGVITFIGIVVCVAVAAAH